MGWFDYTPIGAIDNATGGHIKKAAKKGLSYLDKATDRDPNDYEGKLAENAEKAAAWGDASQDRVGALTKESATNRQYLRDIATGKESVSAMQLDRAQQQNKRMQMSMAANARPQNAAMAARTAAMTAGRQGAALAGQQAMAGIQERQAAQNALTQALLQERGQDVNAVNSAYATSTGAYGNALQSSLSQPTPWEKLFQLGQAGAQAYAMTSDERAKTNIKPGSKKASSLLKALKSYEYDYKDPKNGKERQLGVMAQDLEKVLPQAVFDGPDGKKQVHGAKLAGALAATLPEINKRLESLEKKKK